MKKWLLQMLAIETIFGKFGLTHIYEHKKHNVVDADERCSPELIDYLAHFKGLVGDHPATLAERLVLFMGKKLKLRTGHECTNGVNADSIR